MSLPGLWGTKLRLLGLVDNREPWRLSYRLGLSEGRGGWLSRLGHLSRSQTQSATGRREPLRAAAVAGAAAQAPAAASAQRGHAILDLRQSMVRQLAQFAA